jgi:hypothetical protein
MSDEASITINGQRLSDDESSIMRMAVTIVMAQGIEEEDEGLTRSLTEPYLSALVSVQKLLDILPGHRVQ